MRAPDRSRHQLDRVPIMTVEKTLVDSIKTIVWGVILLFLGGYFWYYFAGNPFEELALIRRAEIATGSLSATYEDEQEDYRGHVYLTDVGIYIFQLPDGREFKASTKRPTGQLKEREDVEYLPDKPAVNRVKGDGSQTVAEWFVRKVAIGSLLLVLALSPGAVLLRHAVRRILWSRLDSAWRLLANGMSKRRVTEILGEPHHITHNIEGDTWSYKKFGMFGYLRFSLEEKVCRIFPPLKP